MLKKFVAVLSALTLVFGMVACGDKEEADSGVPEIKIFSDLDPSGKANEAWIEYAEKANGIKISLESPPQTSYKERIQVMLASGEYPDLILFKNATDTEFSDAIESGLIVPVDDYIKDKKNLLEYTYDYAWDAMKVGPDDKMYGIPRSTLTRTDGFFVRGDWLKKVGLKINDDHTVDLDTFYKILYAFTYNDPDGNGKNDTYGITTYCDPSNGLVPAIDETFGCFEWQESEGGQYKYMNPKYDKKTSNYKNMLEFNQKLFKEKLIDPDAPVLNTYTNSTDRFKRGLVGVVRAFPGFLDDYITDLKGVDPNAEIEIITGIKDKDGNTTAPADYSSGYYNLWAITSTNKHPEETIKFLDWILSDEQWETAMYGLEGVNYEMVDGKRVFSTDPNYVYTIGRNFVRRNTDIDFYISNGAREENIPLMKQGIAECMAVAKPSLDRGFKPAITGDQVYMDYQTTMAKTLTKILTGESPVSEYDKLLDGWYKSGGDKFVEQMNEFIKKVEK